MSTEPAAVVNVHPADYVTQRELDATVGPIRADVSEIKGDVKVLLARDARRSAVSGLMSRASTVAATVSAGAIGALITLFTHH